MMFHPRIIHKGILLALVPLVVNTFWIGLLSWSLERAKEQVTLEHRQTAILTHINKVTVLMATSFGGVISYASSGNEMFRDAVEEVNGKARREFAVIGKLTDQDPNAREWLKQLEATLGEDDRMLVAIGETQVETDLIKRVRKLRGLIKQASKKNKILMKIMEDKQAQLVSIRRSEEEAEEFVRTVVLCGLVSNFVIALVLILLIVKDVTSRLSVLVENANMLPRQTPLTRTVSGKDELSELDEVIHAASEQLIESAEYRRGLMQMMAHDLRSPLTACLVSLEMLTEKLPPDAGVDKQTRSISTSLKTSVELINDLLMLESLEVGQMVLDLGPENLSELIDTAALTVSSLAAMKKVEIRNEADKEYITVDRNRMLQVLTNLISNAIKFSPVNSLIRITSTSKNDAVEVRITDQGRGLAAADKAKLFQKFQQTTEGKSAGGTGLGLAISKLIVECHGGEIGVDSEPGYGAQFWFTIPVVDYSDSIT
jgi:signal transduction histidine kinase